MVVKTQLSHTLLDEGGNHFAWQAWLHLAELCLYDWGKRGDDRLFTFVEVVNA